MNEITSVGNTPIFDQLVRELALRGKSYENMTADAPVSLRPVERPYNRLKGSSGIPREILNRQFNLYQNMDQLSEAASRVSTIPVPKVIEPKSVGDGGTVVLFNENIQIDDIEMETQDDWAIYLNKVVTDVCEKNPHYTSITVETQDEFDGTVTLRVAGVETANDVTPESTDETLDEDLNGEEEIHVGENLWKIPNEE